MARTCEILLYSSALEAAMDGHDDYEYGKCTSCDGTGYTYIKTSGSSGYGKRHAQAVVKSQQTYNKGR